MKNNSLPEWLDRTPKDIRLHACWDYVTSFNTNLKLKKDFDIKFKKKNNTQCITLDKSACSFILGEDDKFKFSTYKKYLSSIAIKQKHFMKVYRDRPNTIDHDVKLMYNGVYYWLLIPFEIEHEKTHEKAREKLVSLDPGIRSLVTGYTGDQAFDFKVNIDKISKELSILDNTRSLYSKKLLTRKQRLLREKRLTDQIKTMHVKISKYLTKRFDTIILGKINSQDLVKDKKQKTLNRLIMTMSLYKFRKRLEFDCFKEDRTLVVTNEAWTSKVCGSCGNINHDLGSSKYFHCPACNYQADRDINASRNILSKFITTWVRREELPLG
jgi:putative transposase